VPSEIAYRVLIELFPHLFEFLEALRFHSLGVLEVFWVVGGRGRLTRLSFPSPSLTRCKLFFDIDPSPSMSASRPTEERSGRA